MPAFPAINVDYGVKKVTDFKTIIHNLGNGYERRINKTPSTALGRFKVTFKQRLITDMGTLLTFYKARKGPYEAFTFTDPMTGDSFNVRFDGDKYDEDFFEFGLQRGQIELVVVS